jgi:polysaccharide export outer membrane protein
MRKHKARRLFVVVGIAILALTSTQAQEPDSQKKQLESQAHLLDNFPRTLAPAIPPMKDPSGDYIIGNDDLLAISVWKESEISRTLPVRSDGKISLPLVGEVTAAGRTSAELQDLLTAGLRPYISQPAVTVIVQEMRSKKFNILGHVQKPGTYIFSPPATVIDAIALAGGFKDFAKSKSVYILRPVNEHETKRLQFNYKEVVQGIHPEQNILIQPHDIVVVP